MEVITYLILFITIFFVISISRSLLSKQNQNLPPSPPAIPIIGHLHLLKKPVPLHRTLQSLYHQFGPIIFLKLGFRTVLTVSSPSLVEEIFTKNDITFANRPNLIAGKHLGQNYRQFGWAPYGHHWRTLRRVTSVELFSSSRLLISAPLRQEEIHRSVKEMIRERSCNEWRAIDLRSLFFDLTINIMMRLATGEPCYGDGMKVEDKTMKREFLKETFVPNMAMNLGDMFMVLRKFGFLGLEKNFAKLEEIRTQFLNGLLEERRKKITSEDVKEEKKMAFIDCLLALQRTEPDYYPDDILRGLISIMFTAGTDTTSSTMEWTMSLLLNHPEVLEKVRGDIDSCLQGKRIIDDSDLSNLPYLHCIVNESLRLFPVGPLLVPHSSSEECTIGGYSVPRGTMLLVNAWAIHRDPKLWVDPNSFKPERMRNVQGEREGYKYIPFGLGRRGCPGAAMGMKMVILVLGTLIQCFEWKRIGLDLVDLTEGSGTTMPKFKPLEALYRPRNCMIDTILRLDNPKI